MKTPSRRSFRKWFSLFLIFLLIAIPLEIWRSNALLQVSSYTVCDPALPAAFDGFSVVHLSDLHGKRFGDEQQKLLYAFNDTAVDYPRDKCVHQLFEEQVE